MHSQRSTRFAIAFLFGLGLAWPAGAETELPLDRTLPISGYWSQKTKSVWDGPKDTIERVLQKLRKKGLDLDEIPYECSWSEGGTLGSIRFESGEADRFTLRDVHGFVVSGTYKRKGVDGEKIKMKVDEASEKGLKKLLKQSALECFQIDDLEEESTEDLLGLNTKLKKYSLTGKVKDGALLSLSGKVAGSVKWKKKQKKLGKYRGSGSTTHKFKVEALLDSVPPALPDACAVDQGVHIYPEEGGFFEGWVELTEVEGADLVYLILDNDFVSILRDFEEDFQTIDALLTLIDSEGQACADGERTLVSVELSQFGKDNLLYIVDQLEALESALEALEEAVEEFYHEIIAELCAKLFAELMAAVLEAVL